LPDLQLSTINRDPASRDSIVRGGERESRGMVSFAAEVMADDSEKMPAYVIHHVHEDQTLEAAAATASKPASIIRDQ
jgi:hypothetical protein